MKKLLVLSLILSLVSVTAFTSDLSEKVAETLRNGWAISQAIEDKVDDATMNDLSIKYRNNIDELVTIVSTGKNVIDFAAVYAEKDIYNKALLNPVIEVIKDNNEIMNLIRDNKEYGADTTPFPGYGYPEPGFNYRKGKELSRDFLSAFWRHEERLLETNQENELTIELKFLADFTEGVESSGGGEVKSMNKVNMKIQGELKECVRILYTIKKTLKVKCTVKFQKSKVWFELFKQKKAPWYAPWQKNSWNVCGKTYDVVEEATGEAVGSGVPTAVDSFQDNNQDQHQNQNQNSHH